MQGDWPVLAATVVAAGVGCGLAGHYGRAAGLLDRPGPRRSHRRATVRGGGAGALVAWLAAMLAAPGVASTGWWALLGAVGLVAAVGWVDDHRSLPVVPRLVVQALAIALILWAFPSAAAAATLIGALAMLWFINAYNFMDGTDLLATGEAIFCAVAIALFCHDSGATVTAWPAWCLAAAMLGFVPWNAPPARVFLGDVGSGFAGATLAGVAWWSWQVGAIAAETLLILGAVFLVDASATLALRMARGEPWLSPHRSHAYQRLARRWGHGPVAAGATLINVFWLWPAAMLCQRMDEWRAVIACAAILPLLAAWLVERRVADGEDDDTVSAGLA